MKISPKFGQDIGVTGFAQLPNGKAGRVGRIGHAYPCVLFIMLFVGFPIRRHFYLACMGKEQMGLQQKVPVP